MHCIPSDAALQRPAPLILPICRIAGQSCLCQRSNDHQSTKAQDLPQNLTAPYLELSSPSTLECVMSYVSCIMTSCYADCSAANAAASQKCKSGHHSAWRADTAEPPPLVYSGCTLLRLQTCMAHLQRPHAGGEGRALGSPPQPGEGWWQVPQAAPRGGGPPSQPTYLIARWRGPGDEAADAPRASD